MSHLAPLETLREAAQLPLSAWPTRYAGFRGIGVMCTYVPDEMLHAAGFTPVRLRSRGTPVRFADGHLPSYTCALCKSTLDQLLAGELGELAATVFAHTCDTMQALADLWPVSSSAAGSVLTVMQPANLGSASSRTYLLAEMTRLRGQVEQLAARPLHDQDLRASIDLYDETRRLTRTLGIHREQLHAADFFAVLDAAQAMPRSLFNPLLSALLSGLHAAPVIARGPRLFLVGALLSDPRLVELIEELGAQVAGDDLCAGSRHFLGQVGSSGDPVANLVDYYLQRAPCPSKRHPSHNAATTLLEKLQTVRADGVLFLLDKFCEPHAFEYALLQPALEQAGFPHIALETEQPPNIEGLRTRLQAFLEML